MVKVAWSVLTKDLPARFSDVALIGDSLPSKKVNPLNAVWETDSRDEGNFRWPRDVQP